MSNHWKSFHPVVSQDAGESPGSDVLPVAFDMTRHQCWQSRDDAAKFQHTVAHNHSPFHSLG